MKIDYRNLGEEQLIRRIIAGDKQAFNEGYNRTCKAVYSFIIKMTRNREIADEITQVTFTTFYRKLQSPGVEIHTLKNFLFGIAKNEFLTYVRKQNNQNKFHIGEDNIEIQFLKDPDINVIEKLEKEELSKRVREVVDKLPDKYKTPLVLYYYEKCTDEEIGNILNVSMHTAKTRRRRAKDILKEWLSPVLELI